jgi:hypothetical protein
VQKDRCLFKSYRDDNGQTSDDERDSGVQDVPARRDEHLQLPTSRIVGRVRNDEQLNVGNHQLKTGDWLFYITNIIFFAVLMWGMK